VFARGDLVPGGAMKGPAVITEYSATTVIPAGSSFWVDAADNLLIQLKRKTRSS
jgi:N-methylhydantoinase A